ncbi:MAG: hypothetical protein ACXU9E_10045, partial [Syntrophales bacterium]
DPYYMQYRGSHFPRQACEALINQNLPVPPLPTGRILQDILLVKRNASVTKHARTDPKGSNARQRVIE